MSVTDSAIHYAQVGVSVLPIRPDGSKAPIGEWGHLQKRIATQAEILKMFSGTCGVAAICGAVSGNLEIIDFDDASLFEQWAALVEEQLGKSFCERFVIVRTPRPGFHIYYRCDEISGSMKLALQMMPDKKMKTLIETKGEGGYVLAPGCPVGCHETGGLYEIIGGSFAHIPHVTIEEREALLACARSFNLYWKPEAPEAPRGAMVARNAPGDDYCARAMWSDILKPHGFKPDGKRGDAELWTRPGKARGVSASTNHNGSELLYLFSTSCAPFDSARGYNKFAAYTLLNHGGDFGAAASALAKQGYGSQSVIRQATSTESRTMLFTSLGELLNEPDEETPWVVENLLPASGDSLLVAKPKVGKSTLARCLALQVSRGEEFLGNRTARGPVFYLALEEKRTEVKRHFKAMGARPDDSIFVFCAASPADGLVQLREAMKSTHPVLVIVDPLFRFVRVKDGNDYAAVTNALEPLHVLARETGAHVLAVHHLGKGDRQGGDAVLGSTALFAAVDTLLLMKRNDRFRTLSSIQRYGTDLEEITLDYDDETRTLSAGLAKAEVDEAEVSIRILEYLKSQAEAVEERDIHENVEGRKNAKVKALRQCLKTGRIFRTGAGKKNDTYRYSVSCSFVPTIGREHTKQALESPSIRSIESADACSQMLTASSKSQESGGAGASVERL